jgi:hypothetical protein
MGPSNDHERVIARAVDRLSTEGQLHLTSIPQVTAGLKFMMTKSESKFLVNYIRWRLATPIAK